MVLGAGFGGLELSTMLVVIASGITAEKEHVGSSRRARWFAG